MDEATAVSLVSRALKVGAGRGEQVCAAVVDRAGHLMAFARSAESVVPAIDVTIGKAYTAATLGAETGALRALTAPGAPLDGLLAAAVVPRPLVVLPGGVPVVVDGVRMGGLGVGGSSAPEVDHELATQAVASLGAATEG